MQRLKELLNGEERGVSPVIGVILMVAITVILAAVIASFVLGLGDQTDDVSPNVVFDSEVDGNDFVISITQADADADADEIYVRGESETYNEPWSTDGGDSASAGESVRLEIGEDVDNGDDVNLVFETDNTSDILDTVTVPEE